MIDVLASLPKKERATLGEALAAAAAAAAHAKPSAAAAAAAKAEAAAAADEGGVGSGCRRPLNIALLMNTWDAHVLRVSYGSMDVAII